MNDRNEHDESTVGTVDEDRRDVREPGTGSGGGPGAPDGSPSDAEAAPHEAGPAPEAVDQEVAILRSELTRVQEQLEEAKREVAEFRDRYLRSRAELENYRRRVADDVERAREAGLDSAVLTVLTVFDDLGRALQAAEATDDPNSIVPGVRAVKESLERHLENLDIRPIGEPGEPFDPNQHEALTAVPLVQDAEPGTIANVFQAGFKRGDRLVRPARVVVYKESEEG
jgi:molecular chaperone GrpE